MKLKSAILFICFCSLNTNTQCYNNSYGEWNHWILACKEYTKGNIDQSLKMLEECKKCQNTNIINQASIDEKILNKDINNLIIDCFKSNLEYNRILASYIYNETTNKQLTTSNCYQNNKMLVMFGDGLIFFPRSPFFNELTTDGEWVTKLEKTLSIKSIKTFVFDVGNAIVCMWGQEQLFDTIKEKIYTIKTDDLKIFFSRNKEIIKTLTNLNSLKQQKKFDKCINKLNQFNENYTSEHIFKMTDEKKKYTEAEISSSIDVDLIIKSFILLQLTEYTIASRSTKIHNLIKKDVVKNLSNINGLHSQSRFCSKAEKLSSAVASLLNMISKSNSFTFGRRYLQKLILNDTKHHHIDAMKKLKITSNRNPSRVIIAQDCQRQGDTIPFLFCADKETISNIFDIITSEKCLKYLNEEGIDSSNIYLETSWLYGAMKTPSRKIIFPGIREKIDANRFQAQKRDALLHLIDALFNSILKAINDVQEYDEDKATHILSNIMDYTHDIGYTS